MRIGFQLVMFVLILNLTCDLMYIVSVPGTAYSDVLTGTGTPAEYQERFNASTFMNRTQPQASITFVYLGHIWSGLQLVWNAIRFTVFGFPTMLQQIGSQVSDPSAKVAYTAISGVLYAVFSVIIFMWLYQLFTGREVEG